MFDVSLKNIVCAAGVNVLKYFLNTAAALMFKVQGTLVKKYRGLLCLRYTPQTNLDNNKMDPPLPGMRKSICMLN